MNQVHAPRYLSGSLNPKLLLLCVLDGWEPHYLQQRHFTFRPLRLRFAFSCAGLAWQGKNKCSTLYASTSMRCSRQCTPWAPRPATITSSPPLFIIAHSRIHAWWQQSRTGSWPSRLIYSISFLIHHQIVWGCVDLYKIKIIIVLIGFRTVVQFLFDAESLFWKAVSEFRA